MINNKLLDYLKKDGYELNTNSNGIGISIVNNELLIKGSKSDLIELANYIVNVALSNNEKDHLHIDDLTIINHNSSINSIIIEKDK